MKTTVYENLYLCRYVKAAPLKLRELLLDTSRTSDIHPKKRF